MLFTPEQFLLLGIVLIGGLLIGYACAPSPRKWKRRVREQSDSFTDHYAALEQQLRSANQRVADLEAHAGTLRADHAEAERTIGSLRAAAMAAPVAAVVAEAEHRPAPTPVEPAAAPDVAEAEWVPVVAETRTDIAEPAHDTAPIEPEPTHESSGEHALVEAPHIAAEDATAKPIAETPTPVLPHAIEASDEIPTGAPAPGDTFPVPENEPAPREAAAAFPTDTVATAEALTEPVAEHHEPIIVAPMTPIATDAPPAPIGPAEPEMPSKGWFASSARDDLTRIRGIDGVLNTRLFSLGVVRFEDLEKLSAEDEMALEQRLALPVGYIAREQWRTQSALLRAGQTEEHAAHFAKEPVAIG